MSGSWTVIIIGGGLAGLALGIGLRDAGIDVQVFEADTAREARSQGYVMRLSRWGRSHLTHLVPSHVIHRLEAAGHSVGNEAVGQRPSQDFDYKFIKPDGTDEFRIKLPPAPNEELGKQRDAWMFVERTDLRLILADELSEQITWGKRLQSFSVEDDGVSVVFTDGTGVRGQLVVGADGNNSQVALGLGIPPPYNSKTQLIAGEVANTPEFERAIDFRQIGCFSTTTQYTLSDTGPCVGPTLLTLINSRSNPRTCWVVQAAKGFPGNLDNMSAEELMDLVCKTLEGYNPDLTQVINFLDKATIGAWKQRLRTSGVPTWQSNPRVTCVGDSIHSMASAGGGGANTAFYSAMLLLQALKAKPAAIGNDGEMIAMYESTMRSRVNPMLSSSLKFGHAAFSLDIGR